MAPHDSRSTYRVTIVEGGASRLLGAVREIGGLDRVRGPSGATVALKGGALRQAELFAWISADDGAPTRAKMIRIDQVNGDRVVRSWRILNARPVKYTGPSLNASGHDVAIEELVLSAEGLEMLPA